jgi:Tol biopolymer transport system component
MARVVLALFVALGGSACTLDEGAPARRIEVGAADIYSISTDGSDLRRLTSTGGRSEDWVAPSPDGKRIAYFRDERELVVAEADGGNEEELGPVRLTVDFRRPPAWSPDGTQLAWAQGVNCGEVICDRQEIWVADVRTKARRKIADSAVDPSWSPDGRFLAWTHARLVVDREPSYRLSVLVGRTDGTVVRLVARGAQAPAFSPDGRSIAFVGHDVSPYRLFVAKSSGGPHRQVARLFMAPLAWSPDGRWIAGSDDAGDGVVVASVAGGKPRRLGAKNYLVPFVEGASWSPAATLVWSRGRRIVVAAPDGSRRRTIVLDPAEVVAGGVAWSSDGKRIFFSA